MIIGMDFGTTNSGMAVYDGRELTRLPLDPSSESPRVLRSALYVTNEQDIYVGREAIDRYFEHNVGRPVKIEKVWVGEIEVVADRVNYVQDIYVWADVMSPGRLLLSFKSNLRDHEYGGTVIGRRFYPLEALLAAYMHTLKLRAEKYLGAELHDIVLGRPVHFADDDEHDRLAQERLLRSAFQAGYRRVFLEREPIAAAHYYASQTARPHNVLVFDFGGGTLDITVMRLGNGTRDVLATGGVPIAGDVFDRKLVRAKLPQHFGEGARYGPKSMPVPRWIFDTFSNWQTILELQSPENKRVLEEIAQTATRPREIRALVSLVSGNYGLRMFDIVEQTKRDLSDRFGGMIRLQGPDFDVMQLVTRRDFEDIIRPEYLRIEENVDETLRASGLQAGQIDAVIRTGGSSEIPLFQQMLARKFGPDRLHSIDTFGSVTAGLGIIAHGIERGDIESRAYTPADLQRQDVAVSRPNVALVDLDLLKRRIRRQEGVDPQLALPETALLLLTGANELRVLPGDVTPGPLGLPDEVPPLLAALPVAVDEPLLLVTSRYRFILTSARELLSLKGLGQTVDQLYHFGAREAVFAAGRWQAIKAQERMLLVTSLGFARAFPTNVITGVIEAPVPLAFDHPLPGWPVAVAGANQAQQLALVTAQGRGVRFALDDIPTSGVQALNRDDDDDLVAAVLGAAGDELLLVTDRGYARRLPLEVVPAPDRPNSHGRSLISRGPLSGAAVLAGSAATWLLGREALYAADGDAVPPEPDSTRSHRLLRLPAGETVRAVIGPGNHEKLHNSNSNDMGSMLE